MNTLINLEYDDFIIQIKNDNSSIIIDVRTPNEYEVFHLDNSILCDIYNSNFVNEIFSFDRSKSFYFYCLVVAEVFKLEYFYFKTDFKEFLI